MTISGGRWIVGVAFVYVIICVVCEEIKCDLFGHV